MRITHRNGQSDRVLLSSSVYHYQFLNVPGGGQLNQSVLQMLILLFLQQRLAGHLPRQPQGYLSPGPL